MKHGDDGDELLAGISKEIAMQRRDDDSDLRGTSADKIVYKHSTRRMMFHWVMQTRHTLRQGIRDRDLGEFAAIGIIGDGSEEAQAEGMLTVPDFDKMSNRVLYKAEATGEDFLNMLNDRYEAYIEPDWRPPRPRCPTNNVIEAGMQAMIDYIENNWTTTDPE